METLKSNRRKRKRRPTFTNRFGPSSMAFELGLIKQSIELLREMEKDQKKDENK
ncbi:hypothetical protein JNK13_01975 [bacterium]|nr:hypothetical protein [bacterium]